MTAKISIVQNTDHSLTTSNGYDFSVNDVKPAHLMEAAVSLYEQTGSSVASTTQEFCDDFEGWLEETDGLPLGIFNSEGDFCGGVIFVDVSSVHHGFGVGVHVVILEECKSPELNKALCSVLRYLLNEVDTGCNFFVRYKHVSPKVVNEIYSFKKRKES